MEPGRSIIDLQNNYSVGPPLGGHTPNPCSPEEEPTAVKSHVGPASAGHAPNPCSPEGEPATAKFYVGPALAGQVVDIRLKANLQSLVRRDNCSGENDPCGGNILDPFLEGRATVFMGPEGGE